MTATTNLIDWLFEKTYLNFRNTLGGRVPQLPAIDALPDAPRLAPATDYEAAATLYGNRYRGAFIVNFSFGFVAVLLALIPLSGLLSEHALHEIAIPLTLAEVSIIACIMLIHWYGRDPETYDGSSALLRRLGLRGINQGWRQQWSHARLAAEHVRYSGLMLGFPGRQLHADGMLDSAGPRYRDTARQLGELAARCATAPDDDGYVAAYRRHFLSLIANQQAYHQHSGHRYHHIHHALHRLASLCFYLTLAVCFAHLAWHHPLLSVLAALLPALAATCHGILASGEFHKLAEQSREMGAALRELEQHVRADGAAGLPALQRQVRAFFELVVQDAIGWHVTLRDKDVQAA